MAALSYGSVCSGIEAATAAWHPLGWRPLWFAEIEPFPSAVLAHRYPGVPNLGDMTGIAAMVRAGGVEAPDVLVGGTPCQAFSVAGARAGLADPRGQLTLAYVDLADAIDAARAVRGQPPVITCWENVPGVLSDKTGAFGCLLGALAGEDRQLEPPGGRWADAGLVLGPSRAVAWRILDAQYFGLAQRRRRVFVVSSARAGFDPAAVLFEFDGMRRDTPPSREAGKVAPTIPSRSTAGGGLGTDFDLDGGIITMAHGQAGAEIGFDRGPTLTCNHEAPIAAYAHAGHFGALQEVQVSDPLRAKGGDTGNGGESLVAYAIQAGALRTNPASGPDGIGVQEGHAYTLEARAEVQAVCITGPVTHTLKAEGFDASEDGTGRGQPIVAAAFAENTRHELRLEGGDGSRTGALSTGGGKPGQGAPCVVTAMAVRRLTPLECERLQGFPDGHTLVPVRGKPAADGPRYKALGNSMAVPCMRWIGLRLENFLTKPDL